MSPWSETFKPVFEVVLSASLHASGLAVLVALAILCARRRLSARWQHALWLLVALRLCLPQGIESPTSLWRLFASERSQAPRPELVAIAAPGAAPTAPGGGGATAEPIAPAVATRAGSRVPWSLLWLAGGLWCAARLLRRHAAALRGLGTLTPATDPRLLSALDRCAQMLRVAAPRACLSSSLRTPALLGVFRPRLLLPADGLASLDDLELRHVLLHELSHVRRHDVLRQWLFALVGIFHWFNPVALWALAQARRASESACDELAVAASGELDGGAYAGTLLRLAESAVAAPMGALAVGMNGGSPLEARIRWILHLGTRRVSPGLGILLLAGCAATGLTDPGSPAPDENLARIYEVGALLTARQDFTAPELGISRAEETPAAGPDPEADARARRARLEALRRELLDRVPSPHWGARYTMTVAGERIEVSAPLSVQSELLRVLDEKLAVAGRVLHLEHRVLGLDAAALAGLPAPLAAALAAPAPDRGESSRVLTADELAALESAQRADGTSVLLDRPSVTALDGQLTHVLVFRQQAIFTGLQKTAPGEEPEPEIGILNLGVAVQSRGAWQPDRQRMRLELQLDWADEAAPLEGKLVDGKLVQVPHLARATARTELLAPPEAWIVACSARPDVPAAGRELLVLLTRARVVER